MAVRPDDIDLFQHVHASRYLDYVSAARYDQMARCYGMAWEEFTRHGLGWVIRSAALEYKRPLRLGDRFVVRTWIEAMYADGVRVEFQVERAATRKRCCEGHIHYTMVRIDPRRAEKLPDWIIAKYAV